MTCRLEHETKAAELKEAVERAGRIRDESPAQRKARQAREDEEEKEAEVSGCNCFFMSQADITRRRVGRSSRKRLEGRTSRGVPPLISISSERSGVWI